MKCFHFLILILFIVGCSTSYVQKSPDWNPTKPQKTLLAHYQVKEEGPAEVGLLDVVSEIESQREHPPKFRGHRNDQIKETDVSCRGRGADGSW